MLAHPCIFHERLKMRHNKNASLDTRNIDCLYNTQGGQITIPWGQFTIYLGDQFNIYQWGQCTIKRGVGGGRANLRNIVIIIYYIQTGHFTIQ